ncbi:MAG TPA: bifunctional phosphopantothenoylcysteine decarboxylase/phosphopantothenate--cysteine ligase CoaBC [Acidimicrobiales bacterium]|jgi:phosphopantothenoylcysteine decarboxylase/phosphopantothenate--cysteine ligase|nr:bifunctional phosphopantothenoylcysteine decarboxylase/phosphopantothenate--cysteine ligase CoaBC [Acidimicrobiales bacterium]
MTTGDAGGTSPALSGRRVVLGVTGGIAAYKAVELCRRLVDAGCHVVPVLSEDATRFVGEVTFSALASERVRSSLWEDADPIPHTRLGQTADLIVVAPATARLIGRYAHGLSDDLLSATLLATRAEVVLAPAMHTEMWEHPAVQENLAILRRRGVRVVEPDVGRLAGGDVGAGRLAEPGTVLAAIAEALTGVAGDMLGLRVLVSAGGTREPIDPVRFIGNRSSGKQGHALADEAARRGASVTLVTTTGRPVARGIDVVPVETAMEMETAVLERSDDAEILVMAAAVADFRPKSVADNKLSKADGVPEIVLEPTPDILATLGRRRRPGQTLVGFAAETRDAVARAAAKLADKGIDLIVANDVSAPGVGFEHDTNAVVIIADDGSEHEVRLTDKQTVARAVLDAVVARRARRSK